MKTKLPQEYDQEKKEIRKKYKEKGRKLRRNSLIGVTAACILTISSSMVETNKLNGLKKNSPIYQEYTNNQYSLKYLRTRLNQHKSERFPEFLSKDIKNELENIGVQPDPAKISSLEKIVKIAKQDNARIVNTPEFKEYSKKKEKIRNIKFLYYLGFGFLFTAMPGMLFLSGSYIRRRDKKLEALDKKYGLVPEESQDSTKSSQ